MEKKYEDVVEMNEDTVNDHDDYYINNSLAEIKYHVNNSLDEIEQHIKKVLSDMTPECKKYYLDNRDIYNERFDIDDTVPDRLYLWVVAEFDSEYKIHNI